MRYPLNNAIITILPKEVLIMSKKKQHTKQFKSDAIQYRKEHPDLTRIECAKKAIGIPGNDWQKLSIQKFLQR